MSADRINQASSARIQTTDCQLSDDHLQLLLVESKISPKVIAQRGYRSINSHAELQRLGFQRNQGNIPALLIPIYGIDGEVTLYQIRPDQPRSTSDGQLAKYEVPKKSKLKVDIPPGCLTLVRDPKQPLVICLGMRSADAGASKDIACLALLHPRGWKSSPEVWNRLHLNGRQVLIVLDSTADKAKETLYSIAELSDFLRKQEAVVTVKVLPPDAENKRQNLDDYLAQGYSFDDLVALSTSDTSALSAHQFDVDPPTRYFRTSQGLAMEVFDKQGNPSLTPITNFDARINAELTVTDGVESHIELEIIATVEGVERFATMKAEEFANLDWVIPLLGSKAVIYAPNNIREHARVAIQVLSKPIRRIVYTHLGWVKHEGQWWFLHAGGAIGATTAINWVIDANGCPQPKVMQFKQIGEMGSQGTAISENDTAISMRVRAPEPLQLFQLPPPPDQAALKNAVRASLALLELAPDTVSLPLFAGVYRSVLGGVDYGVTIDGTTGAGKTTLAALYQQHFGPELDSSNLPAGWASTANYLEILSFYAKDVPLVIDDWVMRGTRSDIERANKDADRFYRSHANKTGRGRCKTDGTSRPTRHSRCLPISTQEATPSGHSLNARTLRLELGNGDVFSPKRHLQLLNCQEQAKEGLLAKAMAGFIAYLASDYDREQELFQNHRQKIRTTMPRQGHLRSMSIVADLMAGFDAFLHYAVASTAIDDELAQQLWKRLENALYENQYKHNYFLKTEDPVEQFLSCLRAALASGRCHIIGMDGNPPTSQPTTWGWREDYKYVRKVHVPVMPTEKHEDDTENVPFYYGNEEEDHTWKSRGDRLGWLALGKVYLIPEVALSFAQEMATRSGDYLAIKKNMLGKKLAEHDMLADRDLSRGGRYTTRINVDGGRHDTYCIWASKLIREPHRIAPQFEDDYDGPSFDELGIIPNPMDLITDA